MQNKTDQNNNIVFAVYLSFVIFYLQIYIYFVILNRLVKLQNGRNISWQIFSEKKKH